jgi:hypothetical protein
VEKCGFLTKRPANLKFRIFPQTVLKKTPSTKNKINFVAHPVQAGVSANKRVHKSSITDFWPKKAKKTL